VVQVEEDHLVGKKCGLLSINQSNSIKLSLFTTMYSQDKKDSFLYGTVKIINVIKTQLLSACLFFFLEGFSVYLFCDAEDGTQALYILGQCSFIELHPFLIFCDRQGGKYTQSIYTEYQSIVVILIQNT
jgi:hypothetical protein